MQIKHLQKANNLLTSLKVLDKEIMAISKYANAVKDTSLSIYLNLSHDKEPVDIEEDGPETIIFHPSFYPGGPRPVPLPKQKKESFNLLVSEVVALQVLGVAVAHKEAERMQIVKQLTAMGFELSL